MTPLIVFVLLTVSHGSMDKTSLAVQSPFFYNHDDS